MQNSDLISVIAWLKLISISRIFEVVHVFKVDIDVHLINFLFNPAMLEVASLVNEGAVVITLMQV